MFEYAPAPESRSVVQIAPSYGLFIDGSFADGKSTFKTVNPATEEVLAEVALGAPEDVDRAGLGSGCVLEQRHQSTVK